jgi:hypothetical protein
MCTHVRKCKNDTRWNYSRSGGGWRRIVEFMYIWYIVRICVNATMSPHPSRQKRKRKPTLAVMQRRVLSHYINVMSFYVTLLSAHQGQKPLLIYPCECWKQYMIVELKWNELITTKRNQLWWEMLRVSIGRQQTMVLPPNPATYLFL